MNRKQFIQKTALAGASLALSPVVSNARVIRENRKIKVAVIGCGSVSTQYLPHISKSPFVELVSCCDIKSERAKLSAEQYKIPNQFSNIDQLLAGPNFDLMLTLTNMQVHGELNRKALMASRNVWSEKPMHNTYEGGLELLKLAKQKKVRIWGAPAVVNSPQFAFMAERIATGDIGKVAAAHAHYGHLGPDWSAFFYERGGGSLPDLGVYNLATLTGLLGPAKSVVAMTSIVTPTRKVNDKGQIKVEAEDNAIVVMNHGNGILSNVMCGFNYFDPHGHEGKGQEKATISIVGSGGNMHLVGYDWSPFGVDMATIQQPETQRFVTDSKGYQWQEGATVIAECMATGKEPRINAEHALHVLEVIQAARESQAIGKRVDLVSSFVWPMKL